MRTNFSSDVEQGEEDMGFFEDQTVRRNFIRKVYFILTIQLVVTGGIVIAFMYAEALQDYVIENPQMIIIAMVALLIFCLILTCCANVRRKPPMNYICLGGFTLAESFLLACICIRFDPMIVLSAIGLTAAVCFTLTIFAMQTKWDFTGCGGVLCVCLVVGLIAAIAMIFIRNRTAHLVFCALGVALFSFYLIFDTQLMLGGKYQYSIAPDEYVFGALNLYIDVCQIFICILNLFSNE